MRKKQLAQVFIACVAIYSIAAQAQTKAPFPPASSAALSEARDAKIINDWLMRMHEAARKRAYVGTFVVSSGGVMSSAKIWHVCEGDQQIERVDTLSGAPRSTYRHNSDVVTFMPDQKVVRKAKREALGLFPQFFESSDSKIADFYTARQGGVERIAGVDADLVTLAPKDSLRFGYRVWTERSQGLVVKLQTLDADGKVLEQAAFSELQLDSPIKMDRLMQMMGKVDGYRVEQSSLVKTTAAAEGWRIKVPVAGFKPVSFYKRPVQKTGSAVGAGALAEPLQWIFSDGLASVSIFVEPADPQRAASDATLSMGATQTLTRQMNNHAVTVIGEVPVATLRLFADGLERTP
jgi:sigma-E factor negative regulatory protein RseB